LENFSEEEQAQFFTILSEYSTDFKNPFEELAIKNLAFVSITNLLTFQLDRLSSLDISNFVQLKD
jgi:hypothetical protein